VDTGVAKQLISGACWAVRLFARPPASTSLGNAQSLSNLLR
jgi:hypothetical protein